MYVNRELNACDHCGERYAAGTGAFDPVNTVDLCEKCFEFSGYSNCGDCGRFLHANELDEEYRCSSCAKGG